MSVPRAILIAASGVVMCGCGGDLVTVVGTVEREGRPLPAGRIVMTPVGGGQVAFGDIQHDGSYRLASGQGKDGAAPGQYRLRVIETRVTDAGLVRTNHEAPREKTVEIGPGKSQEFSISIRKDEGWLTVEEN